ncbi:hypothetical protein TcasGA2_TC002066 [Tribolium castaneum]|uniref:Uncharacterized protein n=1 Tax=Tribolium castaneum TaxID=7070 RepID=D7EIU8_TRICA|nr:hypothetical protein TcasGA2_TC002066 [Tribolium castaneum]
MGCVVTERFELCFKSTAIVLLFSLALMHTSRSQWHNWRRVECSGQVLDLDRWTIGGGVVPPPPP